MPQIRKRSKRPSITHVEPVPEEEELLIRDEDKLRRDPRPTKDPWWVLALEVSTSCALYRKKIANAYQKTVCVNLVDTNAVFL